MNIGMPGNSDKDNDSDDSSSVGDDGYESPSDLEGSEADTSKDAVGKRKGGIDELFGYRPQKFNKQSDNSKAITPMTYRKSAKKNKNVGNKILLLERKKLARLRQQKKRDNPPDSSDDDSDFEDFGCGFGKTKNKAKDETKIDSKQNIQIDPTVVKRPNCSSDRSCKKPQKVDAQSKSKPIELVSLIDSSPDSSPLVSKIKGPLTAAKIAASERPRAATVAIATTQAISCLSSDDDSDAEAFTSAPLTRPVNLPPALAASLRQARQAKARLEQAQEYHAHDVHVAVQETAYIPTTPPAARRAKKQRAIASIGNTTLGINMGKQLTFTCRCGHIVINGTKEATAKDKQSTLLLVREKEPLSSLVERFCRAHSLPHETATIAMNFDGRKLDTNKTPVFYEMEDEDLIDFSASAPRRSTTTEQHRTLKTTPSPLSSTKTLTKTLMGQRSSSRGKILHFSCRSRITVVPSASAPKPRGRRPKRQAKPPPSKPIMATKTVGLCENECLGVLAKRLCAILGDLPPATTKVVMRFDGCILDTERSPKFYDMEDEDMIEVSIEKQEQEKKGKNPPPLPKPPPRRSTRASSRKIQSACA